jgi:hypothetical protein
VSYIERDEDVMAEIHPDGSELRPDDELSAGAVQEMLPLDDPVPYRLTSQGRRHVAPEQIPQLRVVEHLAASEMEARPSHVDLDRADPSMRARARALRLAGSHTLDIADELDVDPLHVEVWIADLPVPTDAGVRRRRRQLRAVPALSSEMSSEMSADVAADVGARSRAAMLAGWRTAADDGRAEAEQRLASDPALRGGLGVLSGVLEADQHALLLCGDQLPLLRAAWIFTVTTFHPVDACRVLLTYDPAASGDRVAHDVATELGLPLSSITATRDPARAGRGPWARIRVADPALAGRVAGWRRALLVEVEHGGR